MHKEFEKSLAPWLGKTMKMVENRIEQILDDNDIDLSKLHFVLLKSVQEKEGLCQNDLAFFSKKNKSSLTRMINTLEKRNYIARIPSKSDKRINQLFLTKKGEEVIHKAKPHFIKMALTVEKGLTQQEIDTTINTLKKIQLNVAEGDSDYGINS